MWFIGPLFIVFENEQRRSEISLFSLWRLICALINYKQNVKAYYFEQNDKKFTKLYSAIFFGIASSIWMYCLKRNPDDLKKLDKSGLNLFFPQKLI
jgi:hypothetical protein